MLKYNIPMNNLSVCSHKQQRVVQQLTQNDALIDALLSLYNSAINQHSNHQESKNKFIELYKPIYHEITKSRLSLKDFQILHKDSFAEGAFGKVTIVKSARDDQIYAMKTSSKSKLIDQIDRSSPMEERLILSNKNEEWLPSLYASFQDEKNLYLVMEYASGGDLQGLLERRSFQPFNEHDARFYCAELILAVERVHQLGYMHRDIKPGNILIDSTGHIKLGDLGSCISIDTKDELLMVGTMPYVSPEMCNSEGFDPSNGAAYGSEADWWSVGIVLYELLYGERPFIGSDIKIQMSLLNPQASIQFDSTIDVSEEAKDLLSKLLCKSKDKRLGGSGVAEIKSHPFFKDIDWTLLRTTAVPPFLPPIKSPDDITFFSVTSNEDGNDDDDYDDDDDENSFVITENEDQQDTLSKEYSFIGYTYLSYSNTASAIEKPAKASSNQEFIAQFRQKLNCPEPRHWEEEKNKLVSAHENELDRLEVEHVTQIEENKALKQTLAELQNINAQSEQLIQSLKDENDQLKCLSTEMETLKAEHEKTRSFFGALQHQSSETEAENIKLNSTITLQEHEIKELHSNYSKVQTIMQELCTENENLVKVKQENANSAQLQQDTLSELEKDLECMTNKCSSYEKQMENDQHNIERGQRSNDEYQLSLAQLGQEIQDLHDKLQNEVNYNQHIEQQMRNQANDYENLILQIKEEYVNLRKELKVQSSLGDMTMKRSIKSLPRIPVATTSEPTSATESGEGRSILSSMLQRERDSLKNAQQALEDSENQLARAKKQVVRLKREIKYFQNHTFQQQQQQQQQQQEQQRDVSLVDQSDRNGDVHVSMLMNQSDNSRLYNHTRKIFPLTHADIELMPSDYFKESISIMESSSSTPTPVKIRETNSSFTLAQKQNQALLHKIEQEKSFIKSTERTIAARVRLSRNKGAIDKELDASLKRAQVTLASLESSLSGKVN